MTAIERALAKARTRLLWQAALTWLGRFALAALAGVLVLRLLDRSALYPDHIWWWAYLLLGGAVLLGTAILTLVRWPADPAVASIIDQRLALKDRLGTALYARDRLDEGFAQLVVDDAEYTAAQLVLSRAFPVRLTALWAWVAPLAVVVTLLLVFLPADLWGLERGRQQRLLTARQKQAQVRQAAQRQVAAAAVAVRILDGLEQAGVPLNPEEKLGKAELAELTRQPLANPAGVREAAAKVTQLNQRLADRADKAAADFEPVQRAMLRVTAPNPGPADAFAQALRRGDYAQAAKAIQDLAQQAQSLPPDQREALRQQLAAMADQLASAAQQSQAAAAAAQQALRNAGVPPQQAQQLAQQAASGQLSSAQLQQQLQQQGLSPQQARQLAQQLQQNQQNQQPGQPNQQPSAATQPSNALSLALQKMSQGLGPTPTTQPGGQSASGNSATNPGENPGANPGADPGANPGSQGSQQVQDAAQAASQQLQQLAQMQQAMKQMQESSAQMQQALDNMLAANSPQGSRSKGDRLPGAGGAPGGGAGDEPGGNPLGQARNPLPNALSSPVSDARDRGVQGRVITSWIGPDGKMAKGDPAVSFDAAVTKAKDDAEQAVTEDRVPYPYHRAILDYFNQMPRQPDQAVAPPAAPH